VRLGAAASNIVNSNSDGAPGSGAYHPVSVSQSATPDGGVSTSLQPATPSTLLAYDPSSPYANVQGMVAKPNVEMATEIVDMKQAQSDFRASLLAYKASSQMFKTLLDATA
jgi:flagellar basal-body rod protein FlgC